MKHTPVHYEAEIKRLTLNLHKEQAAHELTRKQLESTWDKFDLQHGINSGNKYTHTPRNVWYDGAGMMRTFVFRIGFINTHRG